MGASFAPSFESVGGASTSHGRAVGCARPVARAASLPKLVQKDVCVLANGGRQPAPKPSFAKVCNWPDSVTAHMPALILGDGVDGCGKLGCLLV